MKILRFLVVVALAGSLLGCNGAARESGPVGSSQPPPAAQAQNSGAVPIGVAPDTWRDIGSYPASTAVITAFPDAQKLGFMIGWLRGFGKGVPDWPGNPGAMDA